MKRSGVTILATASTLIMALALSSSALADRDRSHDRHDGNRPPSNGRVYDNRYHHDRYYLPRGHVVDIVPRAAITVHFGHTPYYFHDGMWYRPYGARFSVVAPPFGLVVPVLPPFYTTIWVRGRPYYYADDVYYVWRPEDRGYVVTRPPDDEEVSTRSTPASDQPFIYPKSGQSEKQQATDRYECHSWATNETHYDPTLPGGGVPANEAGDKRAAYFRAMTACLEGRGYSVK